MSIETSIKCDNCGKKVNLSYDKVKKESPVSNWLFEDIYNGEKTTFHFCSKECREKGLINCNLAKKVKGVLNNNDF